jgi:phenylalanyl-tRNA synthetase beta subunit
LNPNVHPLALANPISSDLAVMRSTLLSSLIPCVQYNLNRQQKRVRFFELGLRFDYQNAQSIHDLKQIPTLALIAVGSRIPELGMPQLWISLISKVKLKRYWLLVVCKLIMFVLNVLGCIQVNLLKF